MTYRNMKFFEQYTILATDGEIGTVHDFFFDDITWTVRYIVVDTRKWLPGRKVLLATQAIDDAVWDKGQFKVSLTRDQIKHSPDINSEPPVSVQHEIELHQYYNWTYYWTPTGLFPIYPAAGAAPVVPPLPASERAKLTNPEKTVEGDPHLRSANEVIGYHINAADGEIGHVEDFLTDDENWALHYMVVDTKNWLPGRKVLVSPEWIADIVWEKREIAVKMTQAAVKNSPEYDPETPMTAKAENDLLEHYDAKKNRPGIAAHFFLPQQ